MEPVAHQPIEAATGILPSRDARIDIFRLLPVIAAIVACSAVLLPFVVAPALPLFDLPVHLARLHALGAAADSPIRRIFAPHWALIPNLGIELIYMACRFAASPEIVVRVCLIGSLVALFAAIWRIQRQLWGTTSYAVPLAPVFVTGLCVFMGYLNYILSIAIVFAALALYVGWRTQLSAARVGVLSILATMAWFCHIAGFAMFGFLLAIIDVTGRSLDHPGAAWRDRALQGARGSGLLLAVFGPGTLLSVAAEKQLIHPHVPYDGLERARFLIAPALLTGGGVDLLVLVFVASVVGLSLWRHALTLSPLLRPAVFALAILIVICPCHIGEGADVDSRMVMPFTALLLAASRLNLPRRLGVHILCLAAFLALLLARGQTFLETAQEDAREISTFKRLASNLPIGSAMLAVEDKAVDSCWPRNVRHPPLVHLVSFAVIERGIFTPSIFAMAGMHPLVATRPPFPARTNAIVPPSVAMLQAVTAAGSVGKLRAQVPQRQDLLHELGKLSESGDMPLSPYWPDAYQSLLVLNDGCGRNPLPQRLDLIGSGDFFSLFRVHAPSAAAIESHSW